MPKRRPTPARVQLYASGRTVREFAQAANISEEWCHDIFGGRARPSPRFRQELCAFLGLPETVLFPEIDRADHPVAT